MPLRTEHVGSLLRPASLIEARHRFADGAIGREELTAAEDSAIVEALRAQEQTGIDVVTDGEFRREEFRAGFAAAVSGLEEEEFDLPWRGPEGRVMLRSRRWRVVGNVTRVEDIALGEAGFLAEHTGRPYKITLPSPAFLADRFVIEGGPYATTADLAQAFQAIMADEISRLVSAGVSYVQIDNPGYGVFLDADARARMAAGGRDPQAAFRAMLAADTALLSSIPRDEATTVALHVCRGNNASHWMNEGGYDPVAEELFATLPVDRLLLEFDDERSGGFSCLAHVPKGRVAVLGLISTKVAEVESPERLMRRLDDAAASIDPDQLAISPQCGFATHAEGANLLSVEQQYAKLAVAAETARRWFADG
ncbi:MAG TPA: cobalamin-independent methionine synthase II family protein [Actinomycetes bacterium]|nr:cobalamin-independent methionine synthase II family protein [Actinomycetes bacterium]